MSPKDKRLRRHLSGVLNLAKFREERLILFSDLNNKKEEELLVWQQGHSVLLAEAQSKQAEWPAVRAALAGAPTVLVEANRSHAVKVLALEALVTDLRCADAAATLEDVSALWLRQWQALPPAPSAAHATLLAQSQRVREAQEAIAVALGIEKVLRAGGTQPPDLKNVILTWRDRLPNRWDGAHLWDSLLTWRYSVFGLITEQLRAILHEDTQTAGVHDAPWTVIKLAHVARKLGLRDLSQSTLARLSQVTTLDVHDQYARTKEQCMLYLPDRAVVATARHAARRSLP
jgi:transformation/transcription domain-associated protein